MVFVAFAPWLAFAAFVAFVIFSFWIWWLLFLLHRGSADVEDHFLVDFMLLAVFSVCFDKDIRQLTKTAESKGRRLTINKNTLTSKNSNTSKNKSKNNKGKNKRSNNNCNKSSKNGKKQQLNKAIIIMRRCPPASDSQSAFLAGQPHRNHKKTGNVNKTQLQDDEDFEYFASI